MEYTLIHNPGCGSSKKGLELLRERGGIEPKIRLYMKVGERLSESELRDIAAKMGDVSPRVFMREKDAERAGIAANASDDEVFAAMAANPKLVQRPIGLKGGKAVLGRPNSALLELL